ncbi:MAG: 30S ribosome-binding factor RbfA [Patescibacteria group bacterium]|nr:30S ribosome-binding factor RbfA [Patescibacteria group bacterium]MBU1871019.1 30S ribosome-binding factor RbfA [Patescibacteria group bacterium]
MSRRIEQLNEQLRNALANLINTELSINNVLITVCYVDCSPDLKQAKIVVSILPTNLTGSSLKQLRKSSSYFSQILRKKIKIRQIPHFRWVIDKTEEKAANLEKIFKQIADN